MNSLPINKKIANILELEVNDMLGLFPLMIYKNIWFISIVNATGSVLCDPVRISQVLFNLENNAANHVHEHCGEITIRVDEDMIPSEL